MKATFDGIRKAAILVAMLDREAADLLLDGMAPAQAQLLRQEIIELGPVAPEEERRVLEEFFRIGSLAAEGRAPGRPSSRGGGVEPVRPPSRGKPFRFLEQAECGKLSRILLTERPQTIALVLSHLTPERAGGVLAGFPAPLQVDVIRRLVELEETAPEILQEVEHALESRLSAHLSMQRRRVAGLNAVAGILEAAEDQVGAQILRNLTTHDNKLAARLGHRPAVQFEDLARFDSDSLAAVVEAVDLELFAVALVGASPPLVERILAALPESDAHRVRHQLDHLAPIRLSDVEQARGEIARAAQDLAIRGRIAVPTARPAAVQAEVEYVG